MNNKIFKTAEDAYAACETLRRKELLDIQDRSTLSAFYNGKPTMSDCEAEDKGISEVKNHLFAHDSITSSQDRISSIYLKSKTLWHINTKNAPDGKDQEWSHIVTEKFNQAIKSSRRLWPEFKSFAGEVTLFGSFHFCFYDKFDWCPRSRRPMVPRNSGIIPSETEYFVIKDEIRLFDLYEYVRKHKVLSEKNVDSGWNITAVKSAIKILENRDEVQGLGIDLEDLDEMEEARQLMGTDNYSLPVYYLFTSRPDEEDVPIDLTIMARYNGEMMERAAKANISTETVLYDNKNYFKNSKEFIHSFFIDTNIGGRTMWYRSMGLGELNYDTDVDIEELFNHIMQGAKENSRSRYRVSNSADTEVLNRWLGGDGYSNILPEGVDVIESNKNPNYQSAFQPLDMLMNLSKLNASSSIANKAGNRGTNELEVQAIERQSRNGESIQNRMNDIYEGLHHLGEEIFRRFTTDTVHKTFLGHKEIEWFQSEMRKAGIPLSFLRKMSLGFYDNVTLKPNRVAGDGDRVQESQTNANLMSMYGLYPAESQQKILRHVTATATQNYELAEELVPLDQKLDGGQINVANNENQTSQHRGLSGYIPQLNADDIHVIHIPEHIGGMQSLLDKGKVLGWDELDAAAYQSVSQHVLQHIGQIQGSPQLREMANAMQQQIQGMMNEAKEHINNLKAKREGEGNEMSQKDIAQLQLEGAKLELNRDKHESIVSNRSEQLELERAKISGDMSLASSGQSIEVDKMNSKLAIEAERNDQEAIKMMQQQQQLNNQQNGQV